MNAFKKAAVATGLIALFAGAAAAEEVAFTACTKDGWTAMLAADVAGSVENGPTVKELVNTAFKKTAREFNGEDLAKTGFEVFKKNIYEALGGSVTTEDAILEVTHDPVFGAPACKP